MTRGLDLLPFGGVGYRPLGLFDRAIADWARPFYESELSTDWLPAADISETENHYAITVEVPGIDMKALDLSFDDGLLVIKGEKNKEVQVGESAFCTERYIGTFERRFRIPGHVDSEKIEATYHDGVLKVILPRDEKSKVKKIKIH